MAVLTVDKLRKTYSYRRRQILVLDNLSFSVDGGEVLCVLGPSGCGKSTLLRLISALEPADSGQVLLDGQPVQQGSSKVSLVFQQPHLFPWRTVWGNVEFGLMFTVRDRQERTRRVTAVLERLGLREIADWRPYQLSGGMAQRVALARALVRQPRLLLLDEPFSALDAPTRQSLGQLVRQLAEEENISVVMVTHDITEALSVGHRVLLLSSRPARVLFSSETSNNGHLREAILNTLRANALSLSLAQPT